MTVFETLTSKPRVVSCFARIPRARSYPTVTVCAHQPVMG